mmetsp:Transcript_5024/g.6925  ORF Transcript_5024/g.6925 Transcript_5024/m.6925 type:complete len:276 (-) Transcript_5024:35-862(-)|eukprot:CAMPEP_0185737220 /NCGR_PEP_ID=MMETSP1171-20130828/29958_1 /TAXON_ID=374046 /ORGANISM="Helicotheca tamensis, Strain CCMP826" /LENGTH=275 /DNA_ID=CAMNT_0028408093 /DNA_START=127 /DNA_END=954 /DNA_ORIENTATION=+
MKTYPLITAAALGTNSAFGFLTTQTTTQKRTILHPRHQLYVLPGGLENEISHLTIAAEGILKENVLQNVDPKELLDSYRTLLVEEPVPTKAITAATLAVAGDAVVQLQEERYDSNRALAFAIFAAVYTGAYQHYWFGFLSSHVDDFYRQISQSPVEGFTPLYVGLSAATKVAFNQMMIFIGYMPFFFAISGALTGLTVDENIERAKNLIRPLFIRNCAFWVPVQLIQFGFIEPEWHITYVCFAGLIWNVILSAVAGDTSKQTVNEESNVMVENKI